MIRINLLPPELKKKKKSAIIDRFFFYIILGIIAECILLFLVSLGQKTEIDNLEIRLAQTKDEITKYRAQIALVNELGKLKDSIQGRMNALQTLESQRPIWIKVLQDFSKISPDFLWYRKFAEIGDRLEFEGISFSIKNIATLLVRLMKSEFYTNVSLVYIQKGELSGFTTYSFRMTADMIKTAGEGVPGEFSVPVSGEQQAEPPGKLVAKGRKALGVDRNEAKSAMEALQ
ncbi:PilN domain-containing protein [bacterium]|nr:PilN domain-containing protein [bacterium]